MVAKLLVSLLVILCAGASFAQPGSSQERTALKNIEKGQWQKAEDRLRRSLQKDSLNPAAGYVFSRFFYHRKNPAFNLDSACHYILTALDDYASDRVKGRDRLQRISADSVQLLALKAAIDSAAFEEARQENTEHAYLDFLRRFPSAQQRALAGKLRDEVAFQHAVEQNTHQAFLSYLNRYPSSIRAVEARGRYDRLLYEERTGDGRLESYETFLADYPDSPFRKEVTRQIFEILTADGSAESFLAFQERYPLSDLAARAMQMAFHILAEGHEPKWPHKFLNDSLRYILEVNALHLVPVLQSGLYGFMNTRGKEVLPATYREIPEAYLCGSITDEILHLDGALFARDGSLIYRGPVEDFDDLGVGFLRVSTGGSTAVVHKAGFVLMEGIQDARVLERKYLAAKDSGGWRLYTLTGRLLDERSWNDISTLAAVMVFTRGEQSFIAPMDHISKAADGAPLKMSEPLEEVKLWPGNLIWGRSGIYQGVMTSSLQSHIGFDRHVLAPAPFGATAALLNGYVLYSLSGKRSARFEQVKIFGNRVAVRSRASWFLFDPQSQDRLSKDYDSIRAEGPYVVGMVADSAHLHFAGKNVRTFFRPRSVSFIAGMDSASFLLVEEHTQEKKIFDLAGDLIFALTGVDALEYAGQGIFVISRKGKKGLIDMSGKTLLPAEYDAIASPRENMFSLLRNRRFGAYNIARNKLIPPQYDRNLIPYGETLLATFKNGAYGFSTWNNKPLSPFRFEEITYWKDSTALVREGGYWSFYDIVSGKHTETHLRKITLVRDDAEEKIAIVQKNNQYGVISNVRGTIIPLTFSAIVNVGSSEEPLYFTEKQVREASVFVVIYYDHRGEMLRREVYADAAQYDKIYCSEH